MIHDKTFVTKKYFNNYITGLNGENNHKLSMDKILTNKMIVFCSMSSDNISYKLWTILFKFLYIG